MKKFYLFAVQLEFELRDKANINYSGGQTGGHGDETYFILLNNVNRL